MANQKNGFRTDSLAETESIDDFLGIGTIKRNLAQARERVGLGKTPVPTVTGSTAEDKVDSLISALAVLGLIKDTTTP